MLQSIVFPPTMTTMIQVFRPMSRSMLSGKSKLWRIKRQGVCLRSAWRQYHSSSVAFDSAYDATSRSTKPMKEDGIKSLALSVYFKHPELGMKDYEILSRATAFLLAVDPPDVNDQQYDDDTSGKNSSPYSAHLQASERARAQKLYKQTHQYTPAAGREVNPKTGQQPRALTDLSWLEFAPREVRPTVHVVCSSHVLSPYLWKDYYPQDWLNKVRQEHCTYSLEVFDTDVPNKSLAKFALNPYPIHHPEGKDVALIHLKDEEASLKLLRDMGVDVLYMRDEEDIYEKGEPVLFDGYVVADEDADPPSSSLSSSSNVTTTTVADYSSPGDDNSANEDTRIFQPYTETGELAFHTRDRFFALTPKPLPEGLCGGPVLDQRDRVCGVVEGIVPKDHANEDIAGSAAFMPSYIMAPFIDFAERFMLQKILPKTLFQKAVTAKTTGQLGGGIFRKDSQGRYQPVGAGGNMSYEEAFDRAVEQLKKNHSEEEVEAIINTIQRERREVLEIMDREGGDLHEVAERVRDRTLQIRDTIHEEFREEMDSQEGNGDSHDFNTHEAEIVGDDSEKKAS